MHLTRWLCVRRVKWLFVSILDLHPWVDNMITKLVYKDTSMLTTASLLPPGVEYSAIQRGFKRNSITMLSECCTDCVFQDTEYLQNTCGTTFAFFMAFVQFLLRSQCNVSDPCSRLGRDVGLFADAQHYDFIVVGAGVAGPVVASRLSENRHWDVLLLEAGPEEPTATEIPAFAVSAVGTVLDWNYTTVPQEGACLANGGVCKWPRGRMVSGTGGMQGMMYTRGHPEIFDMWKEAGNEGWGYEDLLPFYKLAEHNLNKDELDEGLHGYDGPLTVSHFPYHPPMAESVVNAGEQLGYRSGDLNGYNQTGINIAQMMVQDGLRGSTPRLYLRPASKRENLKMAINAHVSKVLINAKTGIAYGVEYLLPNGNVRRALARKDVILSAGAVASPQLLLLSGVGPKEHLKEVGIPVVKDLPGVGRNLHNHVSVGVGFWVNDTDRETLTLEVLQRFITNRDGPLSSTGLTQVTGFLRSKYAPEGVPDLQVFFDGYLAGCSRTGLPEECSDGSLGDCPERRYIYARPTNILPKSLGDLRLRSANPLDHPLIDPRYLSVQRDAEVLVEGLKLVVALTQTEALQRWGFQLDTTPQAGCEGPTFASDEYWECVVRRHTGPENHQGGSCRLGPSGDADAVVDHRLRVHGLHGLRVVDASVFPYMPNANPISTIIASAEKAAHMIHEDWYGIY